MTGLILTIDDGAVKNALARLLVAGDNPDAVLKNIGEHMEGVTKDRIRNEVSPDGSPFAPLSPDYAKRKKGPSILRGETLTLSSIVWQLAGDTDVEIGTDAIYGRIHQLGSDDESETGPKNIPARPYLGFSADDEADILDILRNHFSTAFDDS